MRPSIDDGSNKETKHVLPSGYWKLLVHSAKELEVLPRSTKSDCADTTHPHKAIVERAAQGFIRVPNPKVRLLSEDNEQKTVYVHIVFRLIKP